MESETVLTDFLKSEWEKLSSKEKAQCLNYARQLTSNRMAPNENMINAITEIYKNHEDFHMGCVPYSHDCSGLLKKD
jgi:hypothetical protein